MHSIHRKFSADAAHLRIIDTSRLLTIMKAEPRALFAAAAKAQEAVAYLDALQPALPHRTAA